MGIIDEVEHSKIPEPDERTTKKLETSDLEARDLIFKAGTVMRSPLTRLHGCAAVFFYEAGPNAYEYRTFVSMERVPEQLAQAGVKEFNMAVMRDYGIDPQNKRKK